MKIGYWSLKSIANIQSSIANDQFRGVRNGPERICKMPAKKCEIHRRRECQRDR